MKKTFFIYGLGMLIAFMAFIPEQSYSQSAKNKTQISEVKDTLVVNKKEEKNRNEMLNASNNSAPRGVNIGLPFQGDILIMENNVPVVYTFWPQIPIVSWKYDQSIGKIGLLSFQEGAITFGKVGFCVNSFDRTASSSFKGYVSMYTNNFGSQIYSANIGGPIGKHGWGYTLSVHETFDHGNGYKMQYTNFQTRAEGVKAGISKKYKDGSVSLLYKYMSASPQYGGYAPLTYQGNGKYTERTDFNLGTDVYMLSSGKIPYYDYKTGVASTFNILDNTKNITHAFYLNGDHKFKDGTKLEYSSMYMRSKAAFTSLFPISLQVVDQDQQTNQTYYYHGTTTQYKGTVQLVNVMTVPPTDITTLTSRVELTKKLTNQNLRLGFTEQYFDCPIQQNGGLYYQTSEANPKLLDFSWYGGYYKSNSAGLMPSGGTGSYTHEKTTKLAFYATDDINLTKWLNLGLGVRLENSHTNMTYSPYENQFLLGRDLLNHTYNSLDQVYYGNFVANLTRNFGLLGDATYFRWPGSQYQDFADADKDANGVGKTGALKNFWRKNPNDILNVGGGIFWNYFKTGTTDRIFSLVSKITRIEKNNIRYNSSVTDPVTRATKQVDFTYNIATVGWSTDIVATPFKNFNIHYLLTLQNPKYGDYKYNAFGTDYNYTGKSIPGLSKVLMEIDPSYNYKEFRFWLSLRYFGKQYGDKYNNFAYNPWWESFCGIDYNVNRNLAFKFQVVNPLNQKGISGELQGADQITSDQSYIGRTVVASAIRPRTFEFTMNVKF